MRMPIKVGNWSPLQLSILHMPIFPWWWCEICWVSELSRWDRQEFKCHMFRTAPRRKSNAPVISLNTREAPNIRLSPLCWLVYFHLLCVGRLCCYRWCRSVCIDSMSGRRWEKSASEVAHELNGLHFCWFVFTPRDLSCTLLHVCKQYEHITLSTLQIM